MCEEWRRPIWRMRERSCKCSWGKSKKVKQESDCKGEFDKYTQLWKEERVNAEEESTGVEGATPTTEPSWLSMCKCHDFLLYLCTRDSTQMLDELELVNTAKEASKEYKHTNTSTRQDLSKIKHGKLNTEKRDERSVEECQKTSFCLEK